MASSKNIGKLSDVAKVISGYAFKSAEFGDQGIPVIKIKNVRKGFIDLSDAQRVKKDFLSLDEKYHVKSGDLLISLTGSHLTQPDSVVGRVAMQSKFADICLLNQRAGKIIIRDEQTCDKRFLYYTLFSEENSRNIALMAHGAASQANVSPTQVESLEVWLPDISIQNKIASILFAYDDLIENNLKRIKSLEEMAQMIYREWFVIFRFPGHEKVKMVDSPLGKIPEGWEVENLFDISEVTYGFPFKSKLFTEDKNGNMPVIRIRDILNDKTKTYTPEKALEKYIVRNGDILIGMDGDFHMGRWAGDETYLNQRVVRFRPNEGISPYFLFWALEKPIHFFNSTITGTTVAHLGDKHLRTINIVIPPVSLLKHVGNILYPIFNLEIELKVKNANLRKTRDLLLPKLISGEVDVEGLDIKISEEVN